MDLTSIDRDHRFLFQVAKMKISEGLGMLKNLLQYYRGIPDEAGMVSETTNYFRWLKIQIQEIECVVQQKGAAPASFNVHETDLQHGQVIESLAMQGDSFVSNSYHNTQELTQINMGMNKKRKLRSEVWNYFTKYENKHKQIRALCQYCKKEFDGSSKIGTTHLRNHIKSCFKYQNRVADKMKKMSVVDRERDDSNFVQKIIKQWNIIEDNIFEVYEEEKNKLNRYLDKLPGCFNVTIGDLMEDFGVVFVMIWFIDCNWKLKKRIIHLEKYDCDEGGLNENSLKRLIQDWNMDKKIFSMVEHRDHSTKCMIQLTNLLKERVSHPFIGNYETYRDLLLDFDSVVEHVMQTSDIMLEMRKLSDYCKTSSNEHKFESVVRKVESIGGKVTSKYNDVYDLGGFELLDWVMGYKEVFCELKHIDPDFTSINFDWDDAISVYGFWVLLKDMKNDIQKLGDSKLANECFPMVHHLFSKMLQFKITGNQCLRRVGLGCREIFDKYCHNSKLVIAITVILDPRFKLDIVGHFYNEVYDNEADLRKIMCDFRSIYDEYARDVSNSSMVRAYAFQQQANEVSTSEFDRYLTDSKVPPHEGFDILEWWRFNSPTYPILAMIARAFLSIPIVGGVYEVDIIRLKGDIAEIYGTAGLDVKCALACTKVWLNDPESVY